MIRRRFLALALAAIVTMHIPQVGWFGGEENNPELEGVVEWKDQGPGIGRLIFERPEGFDVLEAEWAFGSLDEFPTWERKGVVYRVDRDASSVAFPVVGPSAGHVRYRWRRA